MRLPPLKSWGVAEVGVPGNKKVAHQCMCVVLLRVVLLYVDLCRFGGAVGWLFGQPTAVLVWSALEQLTCPFWVLQRLQVVARYGGVQHCWHGHCRVAVWRHVSCCLSLAVCCGGCMQCWALAS